MKNDQLKIKNEELKDGVTADSVKAVAALPPLTPPKEGNSEKDIRDDLGWIDKNPLLISPKGTDIKDGEVERARVRSVYFGEIGVRELTGRNDGTRVEEYLASCGLKKGSAWCAAFVTWTFRTAGVKAVVSGWSPDWFPKSSQLKIKNEKLKGREGETPCTADVFGIYFGDLGRIAHVGFVDDWPEGDFCMTVEGNTNDTGSREGDGVYRKRRLKSQIYKVARYVNIN